MNIHPPYHQSHNDAEFCQVIKSRNDLQINRIDSIKDTQRGRLVIYLESDLLSGHEVNAFMQGMNLVIEAPRLLEYEKPLRTRLIGDETLSDYEKGGDEIGFSEVQLNQGFSYSILSCQMITPGLLKIILNFKQHKKNLNKNVN
ncbi:MAG: hypothetical protein AMS26_05470 [Bacteroides sp. SM23_62]|nr:MAG: hypothetical protein AMS26_05470 [Bacteroides sp. SM23_62]